MRLRTSLFFHRTLFTYDRSTPGRPPRRHRGNNATAKTRVSERSSHTNTRNQKRSPATVTSAEIIGGVPVRTRIPLSGWILAILVTVLSVVSSLTQMAPEHTVAAANISAYHVGLY